MGLLNKYTFNDKTTAVFQLFPIFLHSSSCFLIAKRKNIPYRKNDILLNLVQRFKIRMQFRAAYLRVPLWIIVSSVNGTQLAITFDTLMVWYETSKM